MVPSCSAYCTHTTLRITGDVSFRTVGKLCNDGLTHPLEKRRLAKEGYTCRPMMGRLMFVKSI